MRVSPTGQSIHHDGNEVGRYGRDISASASYFVHYHDGIAGEPMWAMDKDVYEQLSVSIDAVLVADADHGLYQVPRDAFSERTLDGRVQYIVSSTHSAVEHVGDPDDHLQAHLWITPENAHGGYHSDKNEA